MSETPDLTTPEGVTEYLKQGNADDWNERVHTIKEANGGNYPSFWWKTVMESGLSASVLKGEHGIKVFTFDADNKMVLSQHFDPATGEDLSS